MYVSAWARAIVHESVSPIRRACTLQINADYQSQLSMREAKHRKWWKGISEEVQVPRGLFMSEGTMEWEIGRKFRAAGVVLH